MATVTITFTDKKKKGSIDIKIESNPPFLGPAAEDKTYTPSQQVAMRVLTYLSKLESGEDNEA
jgi:hypothetical protein